MFENVRKCLNVLEYVKKNDVQETILPHSHSVNLCMLAS